MFGGDLAGRAVYRHGQVWAVFAVIFDLKPELVQGFEHPAGIIGIQHTREFASAVGQRRQQQGTVGQALGTRDRVDAYPGRIDIGEGDVEGAVQGLDGDGIARHF